VSLAVVWILAEVMIGGLALGALLILIRPRDDEAAASYRRQAGRARTWLRNRIRRMTSRMPSKPDLEPRR
jgi:hypothetical protein